MNIYSTLLKQSRPSESELSPKYNIFPVQSKLLTQDFWKTEKNNPINREFSKKRQRHLPYLIPSSQELRTYKKPIASHFIFEIWDQHYNIPKKNLAEFKENQYLEYAKNFSVTFYRLLELKYIDADQEDEEDENAVYVPTNFAFSSAKKLLLNFYDDLGNFFPLGFCNVDSRGGINLIWKNYTYDKELRINIPYSPHQEKFVYYAQEETSYLTTNLENINKLLIWISTKQSIDQLI